MSENRTADAAAIQAVLADSYTAWEAGDADAMTAGYTPDATAVLPGSFRDGRAAIRDSMAEGFAGPLKGSRTTNEQLGVRFLGRDGAIVMTRSAILFPGETEAPEARSVNCTWVLERSDGRWLIAAYHSSPVLTAAR